MLNYEYPPLGGGGGVNAAHVAEELAHRHEIDVVTSGFKNLPKFEVVNGVRVHRVSVLRRKELATATLTSLLSFPLPGFIKGFKLCRAGKYDVISTHFAVPTGPVGVILSRLFNIPNVLSIYGGDIYDPSKSLSPHKNFFFRRAVNYVLNRSDYLVAEATDVKRKAVEHYKINKEIEVIHCGLKEPVFEKASRAELGLSEDDFLIIAVGRLVKRKGLEYLLQALAEINNEEIKALIIGDGPERNGLELLAEELGIKNRLVFLGAVSEEKKFQYLAASDIFALPSLHEGFGIVFLEAMHCGLPIITTDTGGQTDFITDGCNGFLVPVGDSETLSARIKELYENHDLRKRMTDNNLEDIKRFTISATAKEYERLFENTSSKR